MEIVIDIPEEIYTHLLERYKYQNIDDIGLCELDKVGVSVKNGTPLPKHGRLIDADALIQELSVVSSRPIKSQLYILNNTPTIIEGSDSK